MLYFEIISNFFFYRYLNWLKSLFFLNFLIVAWIYADIIIPAILDFFFSFFW